MKKLYIVNNSYKEYLLKREKKLEDIKYITLDDFKKNYMFNYDDEAIYYLMKTRKIKYDIAASYIKNLYLIYFNSNSSDPKIKELLNIQEELEEKNLLYKNELFKDYLKNVDIYIYGYKLTKYDLLLIEELKSITNVTIIKEENGKFEHKLIKFNDIMDEVVYVASKIRDLNIDKNNIKISYTSEYDYIIPFIFKLFGIDIKEKNTSILYGNRLCKEWIKILSETKDINKTNEEFKYKDTKIYELLLGISNNLPGEIVNETYIDYFKYKCINTKIPNEINSGIEVIDFLNDYISDDDHVFLLGANLENMPKTYKDEDYLSDIIKEELKIDTSYDMNKYERIKWLDKISSIKNLTVTCKLSTPFQVFNVTTLFTDIETKETKSYNYSNTYNKLILATCLDNYIKYGEKNPIIDKLYSTYKDIDYLNYSNKFTGIDNEELREKLNNKVKLSYSSMNNYYLCKFKYYINSVLKLDTFEGSFLTFIGNLYHHVLKESTLDNFDFDLSYNNYLKDKSFSNKELFFLDILKEELLFVIDTINYQNKFIGLKNTLCEHEFETNPNSNTTFNGFIDKIIYDNNYVAIIDYKTGNTSANIMNLPYGIEMQLPIYVYLLKHNSEFKNSKIAGFYLQKILNKNFSNTKEDYIKEKRKKLKLDGYSNSDESILEILDSTYQDSEVIQGMKKGNNGFYAYTKLIDDKKIDEMSKIVEEKIIDASTSILEGDFEINPKRIESENISCKYCPYKDICYTKEEDVVTLEKNTTLDFLGGNKGV